MNKKKLIYALAIVATLVIGIVLGIQMKTDYLQYVHESTVIREFNTNVYAYLNNNLVYSGHNNMTNIGDDSINAKLFNTSWSGATWSYIAIGTGDGSGSGKAATTLATELDRQNATVYKPADAQWGMNYTFTFVASSTIKEAGIFNAAAAGTMAFYIWTLSIAVTSVDTLTISWQGTTTGY